LVTLNLSSQKLEERKVRIGPILILLFAVVLSGCGSKFIYFQQKETSKNTYQNIEVTPKADVRLHIITEGDVIKLNVHSYDASVTEEFNAVVSSGDNITGYQVNGTGQLFLPYIGGLKVKDLTIEQAEDLIRDTLSTYLVNVKVALELTAFEIKVLGEVAKPGIILVPFDHGTILDAIALCGDVTFNGNPINVKLIRETDGKTENHFLDLTDVDIFRSPYYQLKSKDILYVETLKRQIVRENLTFISIFSSLLSTATIIITLSRR
jgi:polysaccharide export outer membrane protein